MNVEFHSIALMCRVYDVSRHGFNSWRRRGLCVRKQEDSELFSLINRIFKKHDGCYGSPKITRVLRRAGVQVGQKRVARIMREYGLVAAKAVLYPPKKQNNGMTNASPNLILDIEPTRTNQIWVGDITYIKMPDDSWQYLSVIMDRYSRRTIAWSLGEKRNAAITIATLDRAMRNRGYNQNIIFHSDKGSEYIATSFRERLHRYGIRQSMNRVKEMNDNAFMESFFNNMKNDRIKRRLFNTAEDLRSIVSEYMRYYNNERIHMSIGGFSPVEYEGKIAA